ncbi:18333_t:CDS:2, partial [Acaulospora morrowiae]
MSISNYEDCRISIDEGKTEIPNDDEEKILSYNRERKIPHNGYLTDNIACSPNMKYSATTSEEDRSVFLWKFMKGKSNLKFIDSLARSHFKIEDLRLFEDILNRSLNMFWKGNPISEFIKSLDPITFMLLELALLILDSYVPYYVNLSIQSNHYETYVTPHLYLKYHFSIAPIGELKKYVKQMENNEVEEISRPHLSDTIKKIVGYENNDARKEEEVYDNEGYDDKGEEE